MKPSSDTFQVTSVDKRVSAFENSPQPKETTMHVYHFQFDPQIPARELKDTLLLAIMATESLHGRARVKLDVTHELDLRNRTCRIDAFSPVGDDLARIFTGYAIREYGEERIQIERDYLDIPVGRPSLDALREALS